MPTYVFKCPDCDHEFEVFSSKMSDRPRTKRCPACGGRATRQISGGAGFLFKGKGFYITDYRSEEYRSKAASEEKASAPAGESKPAATDAPAKPKPEKAEKPEKPSRGAAKKSTKKKPGGSGRRA